MAGSGGDGVGDMFSFDLSGASLEVILLAGTLALALGVIQGPLKSAGWMRRASGYIDLAEKFAAAGGGPAERMAADALRKKAAELVVWRLRSRDALGDGLVAAVDAFTATLCVSVSLVTNSALWVMNGSMSADDVFALFSIGFLIGLGIDFVRMLFRRLNARRRARESFDGAVRGETLDARVERLYRELMAAPEVDGLRDRDADGPTEQEDGDGGGERDGDQDVEGEGDDRVVF